MQIALSVPMYYGESMYRLSIGCNPRKLSLAFHYPPKILVSERHITAPRRDILRFGSKQVLP